ncbi:hypothetical protein Tsubulata_007711 [Turnera subulata]|uniref:CW-type domain-containing protein n=1 Tax=Turnera subulata TaxID=218843 RepID=A0A9Q0G9M6_9ROSI|nr:hypothetical protein Tsubulata_007711 [Turnera subulata]
MTCFQVGIVKFGLYEFYILPPDERSNFSQVRVAYRTAKACTSVDHKAHLEDNGSSDSKVSVSTENHHCHEPNIQPSCIGQPHPAKLDGTLQKNYARAHPSYLQTLGQAHSGWIFGAIAELVDNSRDAKATKLEISIEMIYSRRAGKDIPMLSVIDDGQGMTHKEVERMICFGHKQPDTDDVDRIGRFGVGFKTGAMRLGRDALVLTQTSDSRSIAFLSQSLNEGKDNLEIPIVSYRRKGQFMEFDPHVQSEALAKYNLKAVKEYSPFDKYLIGEKIGLFRGNHTGTQIYIWNLDEWGSNYCLEWDSGLTGGSSFHQGDIRIRSKRPRSRPGQISQKVPLDYSLRSYLEVIFLVPRMKIYVQHSLVRSRPLAQSLSKTWEVTGKIIGKSVKLTLGRSQIEWEHMNGGIFLYWHGRLIEAYKRVGGMVHNGDAGRGVIGVIDVTDLMNDENGRAWVHNNKQAFQDCERYAMLESWLGKKTDEYWDENFDRVQLKKGGLQYKPDHEWVQCDKCRKWRILSSGFDSKNLPSEWFCYMEPFCGLCETPEEKVGPGVIAVSTKRSGYDGIDALYDDNIRSEGNGDDNFCPQNVAQNLKRIRKGPHRASKVV